jgi:pimeloyl-ACP methyl ester carboxylesterase
MQLVVDGILTTYESYNEGAKKTVLILHGWQRSLGEWHGISKKLMSGYRVITLDLPGFGGTPRPESTFSIYDYATFVKHFLDKLEIKKVTLLGHSFGGRIGIILAAKTDLLEKLILVDSAAVEKKSTLIKIQVMINKIAIAPFKLFSPKMVEKLKTRFGSDDYQTAGTMRDIFVKTVNEDLTPLLSKVTVPTLVVWGENDTIRPISEGIFIKNHIPHAKLRVVWGAGHSPHLEKRNEFVTLIKEYL